MEEQNTAQEAQTVMQPDPEDVAKNKTMAVLAYFIFFLPLVTDAKDSPFAKFHANQALLLLIFAVGGYVVSGLLVIVLIGLLLMPLVGITSFVFFVLGMMNAANGQMKELPLIGRFHLLDK